MAKLGDMALKLETYRRYILSALGWVVFGMLFGSMICLGNALILFGLKPSFGFYTLVFVIFPSFLGGITLNRFWKYYLFMEKTMKRKWKRGILLFCLPFVLSYGLVPLWWKMTSIYFATIWYPSLGTGFLLYWIYTRERTKATLYSGIAILLSALTLVPVYRTKETFEILTASQLFCAAMMMLVYFGIAIYIFFRAEELCLTKT